MGLFVSNKSTLNWKWYNSDNSGLIDNLIRAVGEDKSGNIWVGTVIGRLLVFDQNFKPIADYGSVYDLYSVSQIYRDSKDRMWVCSQNDLFLFQPGLKDSAYRFSRSYGLSETISGLLWKVKHRTNFG
jgi:ligand-binding sensor domain-containing protein